MRSLLNTLLALALVASPVTPAVAQPAVQRQVEAALAEAPQGTRFGLMVTDESGRELVAVNPDGRFVPASNTKLLTTAAAYATLTGLDLPDTTGGAEVRLVNGDVVLTGRGDARLSSAPDCVANCLAALADAIAARTRQVRRVIGDASLFVDQRWSPGMSWNNIPSRSGTGIAALMVDDNEVVLRIMPADSGTIAPALVGSSYFSAESQVMTVAEGETEVEFSRMPGGNLIQVTGRVRAGAVPRILRLGIDDPAHLAAWQLRGMLVARGVSVSGDAEGWYRDFGASTATALPSEPLAPRPPPPLAEDIVRINKDSQNLHAELLLRRIGLARGDGSIAGGVAGVEAMMAQAGAARTGWDLSDGSGMSTYNRVSPRAMIALLDWGARQPWGSAWRDSFPIAGVDGTLRNRFRGTALEGRLFAKTGTINAANGLSGYMIGASGRRLTFAFFANDMPGGASATARMDAVLLAIAAAN